MRFEVDFNGFVKMVDDAGDRHIPSQEELTAHLDSVMEALLDISAEEPAVSGEAEKGAVEVTVTVDAVDFEDAVKKGDVVIRTAIHAAGGFTPKWSIKWCSAKASEADLIDA